MWGQYNTLKQHETHAFGLFSIAIVSIQHVCFLFWIKCYLTITKQVAYSVIDNLTFVPAITGWF